MSSSTAFTRQGRVTADRLMALANHLTDRDREIALALCEHRILTSSQLTLLFFSGRRRAMDRLLFLYRARVLDRFYPPRPFAYGKPQAHWLLDEAGAHIAAACLGIDRRALGWRQRENWGTHPQLAHHLEVNTFVTDLIAATLPHPALGVTEWWGSGSAREQMPDSVSLVPDTGFMLTTSAGVIDCVVEWDRGTEPGAVLERKLRMYRKAAGRSRDRRRVLFVVPSARRAATLAQAAARAAERLVHHDLWPVFVATVPELREFGPLGPIWQPLDNDRRAPLRLESLPASGLEPPDPADALGRRWRKDRPGFWHALSPLGAPAPTDEEEWR
jgi:protein involved in plasmid replication-relaxation